MLFGGIMDDESGDIGRPRVQRLSVDNVTGRMEYLAKLIAHAMLTRMGSWEGQPFATEIIPEIYAHLLEQKIIEADSVESLIMAPGVSAASVVRPFYTLYMDAGIDVGYGAQYKRLATKVDTATLDLKFRFLLGGHGDAFLTMTLAERMQTPVLDEIIDFYCLRNTSQTNLELLLKDEDGLPELGNFLELYCRVVMNLVVCLYVQPADKHNLDEMFKDVVAKVHLRIEEATGMVAAVKASLAESGKIENKDLGAVEQDDGFHEQLMVAGQYAEHLVVLLRSTVKKGYNGGSAMKALHTGGTCSLENARLTSYVEKEESNLMSGTSISQDWGTKVVGFLKKFSCF
jgi:hypothetical protein